MAFGLQPSVSKLVPSPKGVLVDFSSLQSVNDMMLTNNSSGKVDVTLWFDYDGQDSDDLEAFLKEVQIAGNDFIHVGGLWVFASGGRITGLASVGDAITFHLSRADV